jgi:hypothetical protein
MHWFRLRIKLWLRLDLGFGVIIRLMTLSFALLAA